MTLLGGDDRTVVSDRSSLLSTSEVQPLLATVMRTRQLNQFLTSQLKTLYSAVPRTTLLVQVPDKIEVELMCWYRRFELPAKC
jgi:hypothetical protein